MSKGTGSSSQENENFLCSFPSFLQLLVGESFYNFCFSTKIYKHFTLLSTGLQLFIYSCYVNWDIGHRKALRFLIVNLFEDIMLLPQMLCLFLHFSYSKGGER